MTESSLTQTVLPRIVLVTGPSGAGRSTTLNVLEDLGFEAIDNLPLSLFPTLMTSPPAGRPLALGFDPRNRDFSTNTMIDIIEGLGTYPDVSTEVLYVDCSRDVLLRRFSETRRRHPLAPGDSPDKGIARELDLLVPVRARADILIDTSEMSPHDLRAEIERLFAPDGQRNLAVTLNSFSFKRGLPRGMDMVLDVRFMRNPHWEPSLRAFDGRDAPVAAHVMADPLAPEFLKRVTEMVLMLLPAYRSEGKAHFALGFGCSGGQHRSVAVTEYMAKALAEAGWQVSIRHRELERKGPSDSALAHGLRE
ncbi:MAG TPA: RNase adapter RapZ [Rhodobacteraceae bacterium]|jgi:UPF0042 nucleotide-binding protein|nr:RNase adapter RapZ [Paracoccaceae bacterium]